MEVVLLTDVKGLGNKYEVIQVKPGYGRNFLLPEGIAVLATKQLKKEIELHALQEAKKREAQEAEAKQIAQKLKNITLTLKRKVTSAGKLYGAITEKVLVNELNSANKIDLAESSITIEEPIKKLGEYKIEVNISDDTKGHFKVVVKEEK